MRSEVDLYEVPGLELRPVGRGGAVVCGDLVTAGLRRKRRQRTGVADAGLDPFLEFPEQQARPYLSGCPVSTIGGYTPSLPVGCQFVNVHSDRSILVAGHVSLTTNEDTSLRFPGSRNREVYAPVFQVTTRERIRFKGVPATTRRDGHASGR